MKKLQLLSIALIVGLGSGMMFNACSDDDDGGSGQDADSICNIEACNANENFKAVCVDEYNDCINLGGDPDECAVAATETCTL